MWQSYPEKQKLWHPFFDNVPCAASYHIKSGSHRGIADMHGYDPVTVKLAPYFTPNRFLHDLLHSAEFWLAFMEWNICSPMIKVIFFCMRAIPDSITKKTYLKLCTWIWYGLFFHTPATPVLELFVTNYASLFYIGGKNWISSLPLLFHYLLSREGYMNIELISRRYVCFQISNDRYLKLVLILSSHMQEVTRVFNDWIIIHMILA